jgi:putative DNA primase/helicase
VRPSIDARDGLLIYSHSGDDWRTCRDYVLGRLGIAHRAAVESSGGERRKLCDPDDSDEARIERARMRWQQGVDPCGTLVETHLKSRALTLVPELVGEVIRFNAACPWRDKKTGKIVRIPSMLTAMRNLYTDQITAVQRTALTLEGRKIERRMLGVASKAAIKLDSDADVTLGLIVSEGFESGLAARLAGFRPVWALGSAGAIAVFPVLPGIEALTILGEVGDGGANHRAAEKCAARWIGAGQEAFIVTPLVGKDLNDVWREAVR